MLVSVWESYCRANCKVIVCLADFGVVTCEEEGTTFIL